jgi:phage gpG-like protein
MTPKQFEDLIEAKKKEVADAIRRTLPVKIGRIAKDHFDDNFRRGGYVDNGFHPWPKTKRQQNGRGTKAKYGPLLSEHPNLSRSIRYVPGDAQVTVGTSVPYAAVHNQGATITSHPRVTPKMRKFAWAQFFKAGGKSAIISPGSPAGMWKALALTKKEKLTITSKIPQRKFLGESQELTQKVSQAVESEIMNILNK